MYLISACLAGLRTRYDGTSASLTPELKKKINDLIKKRGAIPVCPEQLGGLCTPRPQIELLGGDGKDLIKGKACAKSKNAVDYSYNLKRGAEETLRIALMYGIKNAILKNGSPSCGVTYIYKNKHKTKGIGVTTALLLGAGIKVKSADSLC